MNKTYETTILVPASAARNDLEGVTQAVKGIYETEGATWLEFEKWEERKLAYPIKDSTAAVYFTGYFEAPGESIQKIEHRAGLSKEILRHLIIDRTGPAFDKIKDQRKRQAERAAEAVEESEY